MQARPWSWGSARVEAVVLTIALLCTKSFNYEELMVGEIQRKRSIPLDRTPTGQVAMRHAQRRLELRELERPEGLEKLEALDKQTAFRHLTRRFDPEAPLFVDYAEHLESYAGTDRAPVARDR